MSVLQVQVGQQRVAVQVQLSGLAGALTLNQSAAADAVAAEEARAGAVVAQTAAESAASSAATTLAASALKAANLSDLADGSAAFANLDFVQTGTGAVVRTARDKARDVVHAKDFGVTADGTTDDTLALKAALAAFPGKTIQLPPGTIKLANVGGLDFAGTRIVGDGRYETIVVPVASMTDGTAIFSNSQAALGTSAYTEVSHIRFRFNGKNVIGVDLSSVNNSIVDQCYFAGSDLGTVQTGVGVRFGSPLDQGSYSNNVRDCAFYSLSKGVEYLVDANSNMITGGECIFCVIGVDAAPVGYLDTPRIIGMRFEGGGTGIKEKSDGANYIACRFESHSLADIDFINNGSGDQSIRPHVVGCYTATTVTSLRNLGNAVSPVIMSPDMGRYDIEASTSPKFFHGRQVFAARATALNPTLPAVDYSSFFYDTPLIRNAISLEWTNAANSNSVIAISVNSSNQTVIRSFDRAAGIDREVILGGGSSVEPPTTATTDIGSGSRRFKDGYFSGNLYSLTGVLSLEGAAGVVYINSNIVLKDRKTGWSVDTGTAKRTANATYAAGTALTYSAAYVQAEQTAMATRMAAVEAALQNATQTIKALKDDLHATAGHGLIGA